MYLWSRGQDSKVHGERQGPSIFMGLDDDSYATMRSQILALDPLLSIGRIYNMVHHEENHKCVMADRDLKPKSMDAFAVSHIARPSAMQGERISCRNYRKFRHEETNYFELIRYLPRWNSRGSRGGRGRNRRG